MSDTATPDVSHRFFLKASLNLLIYGGGFGMARVLTMGSLVMLARCLSLIDFGCVNVLMTLLGITQGLTVFGLDRLAVREVARDLSTGWRFVARSLCPALTFSALGSLVICLGVWRWTGSLSLSLIVGATVPVATVATILEGGMQGEQRMLVVSVSMLVTGVLSLAAAGAAMFWHLGLRTVFLGFLASQVARLATLSPWAPVRFWRRPEAPVEWRAILAQAAPLASSALLGMVLLKQDLLLLCWFRGEEVAGLYGAAGKFVEAALYVAMIGMVALAPLMAQLHRDPARLCRTYLLCLRGASLVGAVCAVLVCAYARELLVVVFSNRFSAATLLLRLLAWLTALYMIQIPGMALLSTGERRLPLLMVPLTAVLLNLLLNLVLIPLWGAAGAAAAALAGLGWSVAATIACVRGYLPALGWAHVGRATAPALAGGMALAAALVLAEERLPGWARLLSGVCAYVAVAAGLERAGVYQSGLRCDGEVA